MEEELSWRKENEKGEDFENTGKRMRGKKDGGNRSKVGVEDWRKEKKEYKGEGCNIYCGGKVEEE